MTTKDTPDTAHAESTGETSLYSRIRKALKLGQGKRQFHKKAVTLETATSTKMLMIIVFTCERDWALAQHLKTEMNEEKNESNTRIKFALAKKLKKAVKNSIILT